MRSLFFAILLFLCAGVGEAYALVRPVEWGAEMRLKDSGTAVVKVTAEIEEDWHLYSQFQKGTALPLVIKFVSPEGYTVNDAPFAETPHYTEHYDSFLNEVEYYLSGYASFEKEIKLLTDNNVRVDLRIEGQACKDGACVPLGCEFSFLINDGKTVKLQADNAAQEQTAAVVPLTGGDALESLQGANALLNFTPLGEEPQEDELAEVSVSQDAENQIDATAEAEGESLLWFFLAAFGGGIIALLTPCVFPVIPMTVSYFMKNGGLKQALFYGFSIIAIFMLFGLLFSVAFGQDAANYISTHWLPNVLFAVIFVLFAFSLLGYFEISLPSKWVNKSASGSSKAGYVGTFFMALTLVLASFSCTLPIAGTVILSAAAGGFVKPLVGMLGFSLAFALPFTAFALFPSALNKLPKSGSWMNTLKVTLAFVELAFALKFLSVPDQTYHWGILDREIYLAIWIVLAGLLGLYLLGKLRFPHDEPMPVQKSWFRFSLAIAVLSFMVYMIPGLFGAPLNALSGWLPPMHSQDFKISETVYAPKAGSGNLCSTPTFSKDLHAVDGINAYFDYDEALECARQSGKLLFLDFSGHGCVNCRKVEQLVFTDERVQNYINENFVFAALYVDDKVLELPEHLQTVEKDGKKITLLGEKNMYIQNNVYGYNSQPCYIVVDPNTRKPVAPPVFYETDPDVFVKSFQFPVSSFQKLKTEN